MRRALGKGLSQLIGEQADSASTMAPLDAIRPNPRQPRTHFDQASLDELADSIRAHGILQPLLVRMVGEGKYELIAGERRWRAAKLAGIDSAPIVVRSAGEQGALELAIVENVQREDISPLEAAKAYRRLTEEFNMTQETVAQKVGKSRVAVANTLRLLKLPPAILEGLEKGALSEGHARALLSVEDPALQLALYHKILSGGLTVRDVERASQVTSKKVKSKAKRGTPDPGAAAEWGMLEEGMSTYFGAPVKFQKQEVGGKIVIEFYSDDDLTRILDVLGIHL